LIGLQVSEAGSYRPPFAKYVLLFLPPQTSISVPVHTAVCPYLADGAPAVLVADQMPVFGS